MSSTCMLNVCFHSFTRTDNNSALEIGNADENVTFVNEQFSRSHVLHYANEQHADSTPSAGLVNGLDLSNGTYSEPNNMTDVYLSNGTYVEDVTETTRADVPTFEDDETSKSVILEIAEADYDYAGTYGCRSETLNVTFLAEVVVLGTFVR